jgi:hypothetical protein
MPSLHQTKTQITSYMSHKSKRTTTNLIFPTPLNPNTPSHPASSSQQHKSSTHNSRGTAMSCIQRHLRGRSSLAQRRVTRQ